MKIRLIALLSCLVGALTGSGALAAPALQEQRIAASYLLTLGRPPTSGEVGEALGFGELSISDLSARLRQKVNADASLQRAVAEKAFEDSFGSRPSETERNNTGDYTVLVRQNIDSLASTPGKYKEMLDRAYRLVVRRGLYDEEIEYWKAKGTLPFALVVSCLDEWARRNQPGLMVTTGPAVASVNCHFLSTVRLLPAVAEEARAAIEVPVATKNDFDYATNRTVIAAGGGNVISAGRIHFVAAGSENLVSDSTN